MYMLYSDVASFIQNYVFGGLRKSFLSERPVWLYIGRHRCDDGPGAPVTH